MKKIAILTINDTNNYGNRLQNYAVQYYIEKNFNFKTETIWNYLDKNMIDNLIKLLKAIIKFFLKNNGGKRYFCFLNFSKKIKHSKYKVSNKKTKKKLNMNYDFFITGSDQVWNPNFNRLTDNDLLAFAENDKRIAYSASFGVSELQEQYHEKLRDELSKFKAISVRENSGKDIINNLIKEKKVEVLIDPTMMLNQEEWDIVAKRPKQLDKLKGKKYILNYFLGEISSKRKNEINELAKKNNCEIINILDKKDPFYATGPSEFLYLEKNAFIVCTDSFHSCVFSILYETPFIVFDREDNKVKMNSRIDTLLSKFKLSDRKYKNKITKEMLTCNYEESKKILESERKKSKDFLKKALGIE